MQLEHDTYEAQLRLLEKEATRLFGSAAALLNATQVCQLIGLSRSTLYRRYYDGLGFKDGYTTIAKVARWQSETAQGGGRPC